MDRLEAKRYQLEGRLGVTDRIGDLGSLTVADVMTTTPNHIPSTMSALELVKMFHAKQFRHLLVTDELDRLVGVVSDRDVISCFSPGRQTSKAELDGITAEWLMSRDVITVSPKDLLVGATRRMLDHGISCLPVLEGTQLVGIITSTDLKMLLQVLIDRGVSEQALADSSASENGRLENTEQPAVSATT